MTMYLFVMATETGEHIDENNKSCAGLGLPPVLLHPSEWYTWKVRAYFPTCS